MKQKIQCVNQKKYQMVLKLRFFCIKKKVVETTSFEQHNIETNKKKYWILKRPWFQGITKWFM